jgi:hypothetical protein
MDSNTYSAVPEDGLAVLATAADMLAAQLLDGLPDAVRAERVLELRCLLDRLEGHRLRELAAVDARGAAGAEHDLQAGSPGPSPCHGPGRRHPGPAHQVTVEAEPVLLEAARRLDPARPRQAVAHLGQVLDPDPAAAQAERRHGGGAVADRDPGRALWRWTGSWSPRPARASWPPWSPGPPPSASDTRSGPAAGRRPGRAGPPGPGGRAAAPDRRGPAPADRHRGPGQPPGPHPPGRRHRAGAAGCRGCQRLARDSAVTRVLVTRQPTSPRRRRPPGRPHRPAGRAAQLQAAARRLPRSWLGPRPSPGGRADHPGRPARPAPRPGRARRRLRVPWLRPPLAWCAAITCGTGWMAAPPIWPAWSCCAGLIIGPSTTAAGS